MGRDWRFLAAVAVLTIVAVVRVASTHRALSITIDEPAHLGDGYHWFDGKYAFDPSHPPLARVLCALPLRLAGVPAATTGSEIDRGHAVLAHGGDYEANLARARRGNLVLLVLAIAATAAWARRHFSRGVAILAVALFTTLPPLLAHAALITTDLAVTATLPLALLALEVLLDSPSLRHSTLFGAAVGLGLLAKMSFLVYFPAAAAVVLAARWPVRVNWRSIAASAMAALLVLWAGYRFTFGKPSDISRDAVFLFHYAAPQPLIPLARALAQTPLPAPAYALGVATLAFRDKHLGHPGYFLGQTSARGWWYYFPLILFFKTPIPFLVFAAWGIGCAVLARSRVHLAYAGVALIILLIGMTASLNMGIRHILPIYAPLSILAAHGVMEIRRRATTAFSRVSLAAMLVWIFAGVALAHPDYLPWFNELAPENPAYISVDSNLDWGQDAARLAHTSRELGIGTLHVAVLATLNFERYGVHVVPLEPYVRTSGWVAVSETRLALDAEEYRWLSLYRPVRRIGKSIRLYFIP
ncbi:MAG TPA: glycosyltransferase family 39 protein [Thermoanaerobaculia bacterium]|jgi:4-amino-4-deoxy-L-arabinose transferase-like glycosyltransferase